MAYINVVISLKDFVRYIEDILEKNGGTFFIEEKDHENIFRVKKVSSYSDSDIEDSRAINLGFFIVSQEIKRMSHDQVYKDETAPFIIEGEGGRISEGAIERISLRVLSKNPDKNAVRIFNAIRNKLKKDPEIGIGVIGGAQLHNNYFYQKKYVGCKVFKTDFYNEKAGIIMVKE